MNNLKRGALELRRNGFSYSEIQKAIPVSKSTLSHWLHSVKLTKNQKHRLNSLMKAGQPFGARAQKAIRVKKTDEIKIRAKDEIRDISKREFWYMGIMLYWAEGSKQKDHLLGQRVIFNNSDDHMIRIYLKWLTDVLKVPKNKINFEIYSHERIKDKERKVIKHWSIVTGFSKSEFKKIYYKKDKKKIYSQKQSDSYFGLLRIIVLKSTDLNRKISGWINGICGRFEVM